MDRAAVRETQHGNYATQMCPLAHWATTYIQQTVHVTQRHSYLHQSRHRDSATANVTLAASHLNPKVLLVSPLRRLAYRAVDLGAFAISRYRDIVIPLPASAQWLAANLE